MRVSVLEKNNDSLAIPKKIDLKQFYSANNSLK